MLYYIFLMNNTHAILIDTFGHNQRIARDLLPPDLTMEDWIVQRMNGDFTKYNGAYQEDDGEWRDIFFIDGQYMLEKCAAPPSIEELLAFLHADLIYPAEYLPKASLVMDKLAALEWQNKL